MSAPRFYVESPDAFGPCEVDAFNDLERADRTARQLVRDGARWAIVIDRVECVEVRRYPAGPYPLQR